ncbi:MAG: NAD-binding protein, partial [Rikenellaceae bacterium]
MKIIIIGLGSYGSVLATELSNLGHQVIGADENEQNIEDVKDKITTSLCLNTTDKMNLALLPITEVDLVVVAIGENFSSSVKTVALLKELKAKQIFARAINQIHKSVLSALGVDKILSPEIESATLTAKIIDFQTVENSFIVDKEHCILKFAVPENIAGIKFKDLELEKIYHITP